MKKFARLFDVEDTQVLYVLDSDEEGNTFVLALTEVKGERFSLVIPRPEKDQEVAREKAYEGLLAVTQAMADNFHVTAVKTLSDPTNH